MKIMIKNHLSYSLIYCTFKVLNSKKIVRYLNVHIQADYKSDVVFSVIRILL